MHIKKHIPNAITCCNLLCGCLGILMTFHNRLDFAFYLVIIAAILDFFDGFAARLLKVSSPIGKDLDSLADMVTFGVLPGFVMYHMILFALTSYNSSFLEFIEGNSCSRYSRLYSLLYPSVAFVIPMFSALRLAKFNNDTRQTDSFIGIATPANTLLISSLGYVQHLLKKSTPSFSFIQDGIINTLLTNTYALSGLALLMSFLLIAEIPMFALKFKNFGWAENKIRYILLISAAVLLILFQLHATPFIIFLYILLSIVNNIITKKK